MRTKNIEKSRDFNCWECGPDDKFYFLLGGKDGSCAPTRVELPYIVKLRESRDLRRWLNQHCDGWYAGNQSYFWFERDTDAFQALMVHGA